MLSVILFYVYEKNRIDRVSLIATVSEPLVHLFPCHHT